MFANIRRHQKWLWILISGAVIISFVWYFNPNSRQGAGSVFGMTSSVGTLNGHPISRTDYLNARKEAELAYLFRYGSWHGSDEFSRQNPEFIDRETKTRLFLKEKLKDYKIQVTPTEIARWIAEAFGRGERQFTEADYDNFLTKTLEPHGIREADLNRYIRGDLGLMHLLNVAGTPGRLVTPQEAEAQYRRENEQVATEAVFFNASNFVAQINVDPAAISGFYTNQQAMYRLPERIQLTYVSFEASNYLAQADQFLAGITNLSQQIEDMYRQRGTNFYTDTNNAPLSPELAKQRIREEQREHFALLQARKAATAFATELLDLPGKREAANLKNLASAKGIVTKTTMPFSQFEGPREMETPERFGQSAFALTPDEPFIEEPVVGKDAVYVFALDKRVPSEVPPLDAIRDRVTEDYKRMQSQMVARQAGQAFQAALTNAIASGKTFTAAATELGHTPIKLEPFSQMSRTIGGLDPRVDPSSIKNIAFSMKAGETSRFTMSRDGGFILHVDKFIPASDEEVKRALPNYIAALQRAGSGEAFGAWFSKEMQEARITLVTDKKPGAEDQSATQ